MPGARNQDDRSDILIDPKVVSRWRQRLNTPEAFEATYHACILKYRKILEFESPGAHVGQNTGETEWYTPAEYAEAARDVLGAIDLDPASTAEANRVIRADRFFTVEEDGLTQPWTGRVWMNPPYAQPTVTLFCERLASAVEAAEISAAIALVNNATETQWFQRLAGVAAAVCCPLGRIKFWHPRKDSATPLQGQALLYMGNEPDRFDERFAGFGLLMRVTR